MLREVLGYNSSASILLEYGKTKWKSRPSKRLPLIINCNKKQNFDLQSWYSRKTGTTTWKLNGFGIEVNFTWKRSWYRNRYQKTKPVSKPESKSTWKRSWNRNRYQKTKPVSKPESESKKSEIGIETGFKKVKRYRLWNRYLFKNSFGFRVGLCFWTRSWSLLPNWNRL